MNVPDTKRIRDTRRRLNELFEPHGLLAIRMSALFEAGRKELTSAVATVKNEVAEKVSSQWAETQERLERMGTILADLVHLRLEALARDFEHKARHRELVSFPLAAFMEPPNPIECGTQYSGEPVYFVNGIWTDQEKATSAANELSQHLQRPVSLIYNPSVVNPPEFRTGTPGINSDLLEAAYDTIWPLLSCTLPPKQLTALGRGSVQANSTTRRITSLLYHANKRLSIVSHSQGCIIVRNACFALFLLGRGQWISEQLAWVATGLPLEPNEVWPQPTRYTSLVDDNDPVGRILRFNDLGNIQTSLILFHHGFVDHYIKAIEPEMLW
jgi:hypothetical protein